WNATFNLMGTSVPGAFVFKTDGEAVTGTMDSPHTGPGTIQNGTWHDHQLQATLVFAKHESIAISATLQGGKLVGDFKTEGQQGTWEAVRATH
ncbi:MAG TPA: hypothetical protein VE998_06240, partial [Terriglobales bacterium]|nr:hypothetical protein [Terriglobales bacterium]